MSQFLSQITQKKLFLKEYKNNLQKTFFLVEARLDFVEGLKFFTRNTFSVLRQTVLKVK
jgi:hypothetical protein